MSKRHNITVLLFWINRSYAIECPIELIKTQKEEIKPKLVKISKEIATFQIVFVLRYTKQ